MKRGLRSTTVPCPSDDSNVEANARPGDARGSSVLAVETSRAVVRDHHVIEGEQHYMGVSRKLATSSSPVTHLDAESQDNETKGETT